MHLFVENVVKILQQCSALTISLYDKILWRFKSTMICFRTFVISKCLVLDDLYIWFLVEHVGSLVVNIKNQPSTIGYFYTLTFWSHSLVKTQSMHKSNCYSFWRLQSKDLSFWVVYFYQLLKNKWQKPIHNYIWDIQSQYETT